LQAQALVHAHTQAQISAGIYKGGDTAPADDDDDDDEPKAEPQAPPVAALPQAPPAAAPAPTVAKMPPPPQTRKRPPPTAEPVGSEMDRKPPPPVQTMTQKAPMAPPPPMQPTKPPPQAPMKVAPEAKKPPPPSAAATQKTKYISASGAIIPTAAAAASGLGVDDEEDGEPMLPPTSPEFLAKLNESLTEFWSGQLQEMHVLGTDKVQTEQDFKNHNDLPLARIKRIMKSDEDVRMISAEAPVLFAKACEMFILEMSLRSWNYSENNKRKTLQKEDVKEAIQRTDIYDFLVDVIN
jgi:histone H3/H4